MLIFAWILLVGSVVFVTLAVLLGCWVLCRALVERWKDRQFERLIHRDQYRAERAQELKRISRIGDRR